jgi:hypothetical protein
VRHFPINQELVLLYWGVGRDILSRQEGEGRATKVIDRLALDRGRAFPEITGLSARNLKYMRPFSEARSDREFCATGLLYNCLGATTSTYSTQ